MAEGDDIGEVWKRREPDSPCVKICTVHPVEGLCIGCYRTRDEIAAWGRMAPEARLALMAELPLRAPRLARRRGGRGARTEGRGGGGVGGGADQA